MITKLMRLGALLLLVAATALLITCSSKKSGGPIQGPVYTATDFFVSITSGDDANIGKKDTPFRSIQRGIDTAAVTGGRVFVAEGVYTENLVLATGVSLFGGYKEGTFAKDASAITTVSDWIVPIAITGSDNVTIDGFTIICTDAVLPGGSSVAISLSDAQGVTISNNVIRAGRGAAGFSPSRPTAQSKSPDGEPGTEANNTGCELFTCPVWTAGGLGGRGAGISGGAGGWANIDYSYNGQSGEGVNAGVGGEGKRALGGRGGDGDNGGAGLSTGANGSGGGAWGSITSGAYLPSPGVDGLSGDDGSGGGGGGGGGGGLSKGASGGGGGAGALGGYGGKGGNGGGASIGILISGDSQATISNNTITLGTGGAGGAGTLGGDPGTPGAGGAGGSGNLFGSAGGNGGRGGAGKAGGFGGGGGGGPAVGIVETASSSTTISNNAITLGDGGPGGTSGGNEGANGHSAEYLKL
jgi:hypothetical protein